MNNPNLIDKRQGISIGGIKLIGSYFVLGDKTIKNSLIKTFSYDDDKETLLVHLGENTTYSKENFTKENFFQLCELYFQENEDEE